MESLTVRPPEEEEIPALAELRWQWILEKGASPSTGRDEFVSAFARWARENRSSHRPVILLRGREILGMAWLALVPRVPTPLAVERSSGDVQGVYVVAHERGRGHGGRLIAALLRLAEDLGLERVTVHSSERAVPVYERSGFTASPRLLQAGIPNPAR
ncbi:GNAT family N-acetyltransferase [Prauserella shujinwangii]|nr:GNAT family N-acetyltransferase [Prauserella shujinwangii]